MTEDKKVTRYIPTFHNSEYRGMQEDETGDFVRYEDYADLEKRLAEAEESKRYAWDNTKIIEKDRQQAREENANLRARLQDAETALQGAMAGLAERDELKRRLQDAEEQLKDLK